MPRGVPKTGKRNVKPHAGQFRKGATDERRNNAGQRSAEAVATSAQARTLYVQVLNEQINAPLSAEMSNLEYIVRKHVRAAKDGDAQQREQMFDRIWGKAVQEVDLKSSDGSMTPGAVMFIPYGLDTRTDKDNP